MEANRIKASKGIIKKIETEIFTERKYFFDNNEKQLFRYIKSLHEKYIRTTSLHQPASKTYGELHKAFNKAQKVLANKGQFKIQFEDFNSNLIHNERKL